MCWRSSRSFGGNEPLSSAVEALWLLLAYQLARSSIQNWISPSSPESTRHYAWKDDPKTSRVNTAGLSASTFSFSAW